MTAFGVGEIVERISSDSKAERVAFIKACPASRMQEIAIDAASMEMVEMRAQALDFLSSTYATAGPYDAAATFGEATYHLARSLYQDNSYDSDTCRQIAGRGALSWMSGLMQLGRHKDALHAIGEPLDWLAQIGDVDSIDMLRLKQVEVELALERYDDADEHLSAITVSNLPSMVQVTARAHRMWIDKRKGGGAELPSEYPSYASTDLFTLFTGDAGEHDQPITAKYGNQLRQVAGTIINRFFGGDTGQLNEFTVRQQIIDAGYLFTDPTKGQDPNEIAKIIPVLIHGRDWMHAHKFVDTENDACWSLYLCYSRIDRPGLAARELQRLRKNIERARSQISDPNERSRLSSRYPYLYQSLATMLYAIGDVDALFEVIEASKGRVLADLQTLRRGKPADDIEFVDSVRAIPSLIKRSNAAYLTYLVDDDVTFAVLVDRTGRLSAHRIECGIASLERLAIERDPRRWGKRNPDTGEQIPMVDEELAPLVGVFRDAKDDGTTHLCYSPHGPLLSLPLHCARLDGRSLVERFSVSRVHGAASLFQILAHVPSRPDEFLSLEVPAVQDLNNADKVAALGEPCQWLQDNLSNGSRLQREAADAAALASQNTTRRVVHFATHGTFPDKPLPGSPTNPYRNSGVVLAADGQLPDLSMIFKHGSNLLSPADIVRLGLNFTQSHVSLGACVTGLAKADVGGDALGLEFALLQLGAQSILSTNWDTSAHSMAQFLVAFYTHWLKGEKSRADAWREAVHQCRLQHGESTEAAYHWAAFSLTGDWR